MNQDFTEICLFMYLSKIEMQILKAKIQAHTANITFCSCIPFMSYENK